MLLEYNDKANRKPHMLIDMILSDTKYVDDSEWISNMIIYVIVAFDTMANTLFFSFCESVLHGEEQSKLHIALHEYLRSSEASNCPAMKHIIREIMCMYLIVAVGSACMTGAGISLPTQSTLSHWDWLCSFPIISFITMRRYSRIPIHSYLLVGRTHLMWRWELLWHSWWDITVVKARHLPRQKCQRFYIAWLACLNLESWKKVSPRVFHFSNQSAHTSSLRRQFRDVHQGIGRFVQKKKYFAQISLK